MKKYRLVVTSITDYDEDEIPRIHQSLANTFSPKFSQDLFDTQQAMMQVSNCIAKADILKIEDIKLQ